MTPEVFSALAAVTGGLLTCIGGYCSYRAAQEAAKIQHQQPAKRPVSVKRDDRRAA